jgi:hypothetical protein
MIEAAGLVSFFVKSKEVVDIDEETLLSVLLDPCWMIVGFGVRAPCPHPLGCIPSLVGDRGNKWRPGGRVLRCASRRTYRVFWGTGHCNATRPCVGVRSVGVRSAVRDLMLSSSSRLLMFDLREEPLTCQRRPYPPPPHHTHARTALCPKVRDRSFAAAS